jgi:hypothetical protein
MVANKFLENFKGKKLFFVWFNPGNFGKIYPFTGVNFIGANCTCSSFYYEHYYFTLLKWFN